MVDFFFFNLLYETLGDGEAIRTLTLEGLLPGKLGALFTSWLYAQEHL